MTDALTALARRLEAEGFDREERGPDPESFGNRVIDFVAPDLRVRLTLDRDRWAIEVGSYDPDIWRAALEGTDPTDPMGVDEQADWVREHLPELRRGAQDPDLDTRLDEIATARAELWFG